jgi:hypothetical protein
LNSKKGWDIDPGSSINAFVTFMVFGVLDKDGKYIETKIFPVGSWAVKST